LNSIIQAMMMSGDARPYKIPFVGDANVGKTSLIARYASNVFLDSPIATVGVSNVQVRLSFANDEFMANIWDTAGQERFRSLVPLYVRDSDILILVFSVSSIDSFRGLNNWLNQIRNDMKLTCPVILVGNKADLSFEVDRPQVSRWGRDRQCRVVFTSAKNDANIHELFQLIAELLSNTKQKPRMASKINLSSVSDDDDCC
jgi:small GTP-binding protein